MKRLAAALPIAVATAALLAPAVSSASGNAAHPAKKQQKQQLYRAHDGPCPFSSDAGTAADL